jgi:hypothetical protein
MHSKELEKRNAIDEIRPEILLYFWLGPYAISGVRATDIERSKDGVSCASRAAAAH